MVANRKRKVSDKNREFNLINDDWTAQDVDCFVQQDSCSRVCRSLNESACYDPYWKLQCKIHWQQETCPRNFSWRQYFVWLYNDFGAYIDVYGRVVKAWDKIKAFCRLHCPVVLNTLNEGTTERHLDKLENMLGQKLPKDFRCIYRIHNGQKSNNSDTVPGLFGSTDIWDERQNERMMQIHEIMAFVAKGVDSCVGLLPVGVSSRDLSLEPNDCHWMCVSDHYGLEVGQIYQSWEEDLYPDELEDASLAVRGSSYLEWFEKLSEFLANPLTELVTLLPKNCMSRLYHQTWHETLKNHVKICVAVVVKPREVWRPQEFTTIVIDRCVILSMDSAAPANRSCKLLSCRWITTKGRRKISQCSDDAALVAGGNSVLKPGTAFRYTSDSASLKKNENVKGVYKFRYLGTSEDFDIETDPILPVWPDSISSAQRKEKERRRFH